MVIPPTFDQVYPFEGGRAKVKMGEDAWFIDNTGQRVELLW